jgi:hypothetical protein
MFSTLWDELPFKIKIISYVDMGRPTQLSRQQVKRLKRKWFAWLALKHLLLKLTAADKYHPLE